MNMCTSYYKTIPILIVSSHVLYHVKKALNWEFNPYKTCQETEFIYLHNEAW